MCVGPGVVSRYRVEGSEQVPPGSVRLVFRMHYDCRTHSNCIRPKLYLLSGVFQFLKFVKKLEISGADDTDQEDDRIRFVNFSKTVSEWAKV